jgi:hypothetical protein
LGLRLLAHDAERARRQWQGILDGTCSESDAGLVFRWPDSPLRIAVTVDERASEGPLAIEVTADRPLHLPDTPHPDLGARFVQVDP